MTKKQEELLKIPAIKIGNKRLPKTPNQEDYIASMEENPITICHGVAGVGKTSLAVYQACKMLAAGQVQKIILTRPMVQAGNGLGFLPGDLNEKFAPYLVPLLSEVELFLGPALTSQLVSLNIIELLPLELIRGRNLHNSFCIGSEMQNADFDQILAFLSRIGKNSKMVVEGDPRQGDLGWNSGLIHAERSLASCKYVGSVKLTEEDIQRSPILKDVLGCMEKYKEEILYPTESEDFDEGSY